MDDPTGNKMLLVMDYMEGGPVMTRDALERGRCIPEPLALQYFRDMCKVLPQPFLASVSHLYVPHPQLLKKLMHHFDTGKIKGVCFHASGHTCLQQLRSVVNVGFSSSACSSSSKPALLLGS